MVLGLAPAPRPSVELEQCFPRVLKSASGSGKHIGHRAFGRCEWSAKASCILLWCHTGAAGDLRAPQPIAAAAAFASEADLPSAAGAVVPTMRRTLRRRHRQCQRQVQKSSPVIKCRQPERRTQHVIPHCLQLPSGSSPCCHDKIFGQVRPGKTMESTVRVWSRSAEEVYEVTVTHFKLHEAKAHRLSSRIFDGHAASGTGGVRGNVVDDEVATRQLRSAANFHRVSKSK